MVYVIMLNHACDFCDIIICYLWIPKHFTTTLCSVVWVMVMHGCVEMLKRNCFTKWFDDSLRWWCVYE